MELGTCFRVVEVEDKVGDGRWYGYRREEPAFAREDATRRPICWIVFARDAASEDVLLERAEGFMDTLEDCVRRGAPAAAVAPSIHNFQVVDVDPEICM